MDLDPSLYLLLIISSVLVPGFFVLLGILLLFSWVSLVGLVARRISCAGRNSNISWRARTRRVERHHHIAASIAQCHGRDHDISCRSFCRRR